MITKKQNDDSSYLVDGAWWYQLARHINIHMLKKLSAFHHPIMAELWYEKLKYTNHNKR